MVLIVQDMTSETVWCLENLRLLLWKIMLSTILWYDIFKNLVACVIKKREAVSKHKYSHKTKIYLTKYTTYMQTYIKVSKFQITMLSHCPWSCYIRKYIVRAYANSCFINPVVIGCIASRKIICSRSWLGITSSLLSHC